MTDFACAKRAADPSNEFAACRSWCRRIDCLSTELDREMVEGYLESFKDVPEDVTFESMGWTRTPELNAAVSIYQAMLSASPEPPK